MNDPTALTLSQIEDAFKHQPGIGETGQFIMARRFNKQITFIWRDREFNLNHTPPIPFWSHLAEPMRLALAGKSGTIVRRDYRNVTVLAAYEPVAILNFGVVAKVDLEEIRHYTFSSIRFCEHLASMKPCALHLDTTNSC